MQIGCSRGNEIIEPEIEQDSTSSFKYIAGYMFYEGNFDTSSKITIDFNYSKPVKRTLPANGSGTIGGSGTINDGSLYEEISYNGNTITILKRSLNLSNIIQENKQILNIRISFFMSVCLCVCLYPFLIRNILFC